MRLAAGGVVLLALDAGWSGAGAAVIRVDGDRRGVIETAGDEARTHGERLPVELMAVLREAGATIEDVDRLAVVVGPGSFTGLRVGIATIQGLPPPRPGQGGPGSPFQALAWDARGPPGTADGAISTG